MKKIITLFLSLFAITSIFAQSYVKGTDYKLSKDEKTLERWLGDQTDVDMQSDAVLKNVKRIGKGAFAKYSTEEAPAWYGAYDENTKLQSITFPEGLETIDSFTFINCTALSGVLSLPGSVTTIGGYAFSGCKNLSGSLIIPDNVETIEYGAFQYCIGLNGNLKIGSSVTAISEYAFLGCENLKGDLIIPNDVIYINSQAFSNCSGFDGSLTIGSSVTEIGSYVFHGCNFTSITSLAAVPPKTDFTDMGVPPGLNPSLNTSLTLFVPKDSKQDYEKHEYWSKFTIEANTAGIKDFKSASVDLRFYPSPVDNVLNIDCESGIQEYTLYNMAGKLLANRSFAEATVSCEVDMSQLEAGMYLIHIKTKAGQTTFKVMKK